MTPSSNDHAPLARRRAATRALPYTARPESAARGPRNAHTRAEKKRCEDVLPNEDEAALLLDGYYPALDRDEALDHWLLRFVDGVRDGIDLADAESTLRDSLAWRRGVGRIVLEKAQEAVNEASNATADASASTTARQKGRWRNAPVQKNLPHKFAVGEFLTDEQLTYVLDGQRARLVCCIQGRRIDEDGLMRALEAQSSPDDHAMTCVDVEEAVDTLAMRRLQHSFLYSKAVNARVCALLSLKTGVMVTVVTVNDLKDVALRSTKLAGQFRAALGGAARRGDRLFPTLAGPTVIANLPKAIQLLVGLVANLFPVSVRRFLTFARIDSLDDGLRRLLVEPDASAAFLDDVDEVIDKMLRGCRRTLSSKLVRIVLPFPRRRRTLRTATKKKRCFREWRQGHAKRDAHRGACKSA